MGRNPSAGVLRTNDAYFFECLNFAKVFSLPLVFVCENNGYGEYTPMAASTAGEISAQVFARLRRGASRRVPRPHPSLPNGVPA